MSAFRILIVDDDAAIRGIYARVLAAEGYDVRVADGAYSALEQVGDKEPDAMILDWKMPYIDGLGLLYRLRSAGLDMPVAFVTGVHDIDDDTMHELRALDAELRFKPLSVAEIQGVARGLVQKRLSEEGRGASRTREVSMARVVR
jgi:DNA-binding response OmpR family regulator